MNNENEMLISNDKDIVVGSLIFRGKIKYCRMKIKLKENLFFSVENIKQKQILTIEEHNWTSYYCLGIYKLL